MKNVILTGMMGCGKNTLGARVASMLGLPFEDMDAFIERSEGMTISEIFARHGEEYFRDRETEAVMALCKYPEGKIIAAGGGAPLRAANLEIFRKTGVVVFIDRDPSLIVKSLDTETRPLLADGPEKFFDIYDRRIEIYRESADIVLENHGSLAQGADKLAEIVRGIRLSNMRLAVIGDPIEHSLSPNIHLPILREYCLNPACDKVHVRRDGLGDWVKRVREEGVDGFNVTMPHKAGIMEFLDEIHPEAEFFQSVNTVVNKGGRLYGYNTDAEGFVAALEDRGVEVRGSRALILGAGGAAGALSLKLALCGAESIVILNRGSEKAEKIAASIRELAPSIKVSTGGFDTITISEYCRHTDILINATPLGMAGSDAGFKDLSFIDSLPKTAFVSDLIYSPPMTEFLHKAESLSLTFQNGLDMLIYQGIIADEYYLDIKIDRAKAARRVRLALGGKIDNV